MTTRRAFITGCAATALAAPIAARAASESLATLAARSGRFFGSAISSSALQSGDEAYRGLLDRECDVWVPEWQLKWGALTPELGAPPDFTTADTLVSAGTEAGKRLRGHALVWHEHLPKGAEALSTPADWDRFVAPHISDTARRYAGRIFQWDVVNEAIEPRDGGGDLMRRTPFYRMLGPDYVAEAFRLSHDAAPDARLYLNDYAVCYAESWQEQRRTGLLRLLEKLRAANVPIHGFGIQGHLDTRHHFDEAVFARFLSTLEDMGLEIAVTELDVREADGAANTSLSRRQQRAADEVRKVMAVALDSHALTGIVTWGLSDRESWLRKTPEIADNQGLPYDDRLRPTPMRETLASLFAKAARRPTP